MGFGEKKWKRERLAEWQNIAPVYHVLVSLRFRFLSNNELNLDFLSTQQRGIQQSVASFFLWYFKSAGKFLKVFKYICWSTCMYLFPFFIYLISRGPGIGYRTRLTSVCIPLIIHFRTLLLRSYVFRQGLCGYLAIKERERAGNSKLNSIS